MKTSFLNKVLSFTMAFVVLFSTLSFTVESHFCGNNLIDTAIFSKAKKCGMELSTKTSTKKSCCKDEVDVIKGQDKLKLNASNNLDFNQQIVFTAYVYTYVSLFKSLPKQIIPHKDYSPPNLIYNIQVLDQTFLI